LPAAEGVYAADVAVPPFALVVTAIAPPTCLPPVVKTGADPDGPQT
jgi:hypothetical protein